MTTPTWFSFLNNMPDVSWLYVLLAFDDFCDTGYNCFALALIVVWVFEEQCQIMLKLRPRLRHCARFLLESTVQRLLLTLSEQRCELQYIYGQFSLADITYD